MFPYPPSGCKNHSVTPKGYGIWACDLGVHGFVEPVTISNPQAIDLTAYAVGDARNLFVTIINETHSSIHDTVDAEVTICSAHFTASGVADNRR